MKRNTIDLIRFCISMQNAPLYHEISNVFNFDINENRANVELYDISGRSLGLFSRLINAENVEIIDIKYHGKDVCKNTSCNVWYDDNDNVKFCLKCGIKTKFVENKDFIKSIKFYINEVFDSNCKIFKAIQRNDLYKYSLDSNCIKIIPKNYVNILEASDKDIRSFVEANNLFPRASVEEMYQLNDLKNALREMKINYHNDVKFEYITTDITFKCGSCDKEFAVFIGNNADEPFCKYCGSKDTYFLKSKCYKRFNFSVFYNDLIQTEQE